ncbi:MAG TPA: chloride channel protein [Dongiaceae bacterium]|nr:chloride channel protein [Dongiaceae bacterium]
MTSSRTSSNAAAIAPARPAADRRPAVHLGDFTADRRVLMLMAMALVVGAGGVFAAWVLTRLIALCGNLAYRGAVGFSMPHLADMALGIGTIAIPVIGGLVIGLMARYGSEKIRGHGIPEAMEAILFGKSRMDPKIAVLKPLSSAISIGTGGPFGAEGPIIMTGGAIGSLFAQLFHLSAAERKTLLVAGAAAGMTAIFGTPLAAVLLAVELLLFEWKPRSFLPVTVAVIVATAARPLAMDAAPLFPMTPLPSLAWPLFVIAAAIGLVTGVLGGLLSISLYAIEDLFHKLPCHWMWWPAIGGIVVGIGGVIDPAALSVGYVNIQHMLQGDMLLRAVLLLLVVKAVIWVVALGSGTSGGVLAPLLMIGGALGFVLGAVVPASHGLGGQPALFAMFGMAAMMAGTMRAPLTASLFAVELTGNYLALLPVLAACAAAYAVTVLLLKRSILTEKIARRGLHISQEYGIDPFDLARIRDVMVRAVDTVPATMTIAAAIDFFTGDSAAGETRHRAYPVIDAQGMLRGMVSRADVLAWTRDAGFADSDPATIALADLISDAGLAVVHPEDLVGTAADLMAQSEIGRLPVTDRASGRLVGLVARKDLLQARTQMRRLEQERAALLLRGKPAKKPAVPVPSELGR